MAHDFKHKINGGCYVNAKRRSTKRPEFVRNWELYLNFPKMLQCGDHEIPTHDPNGEDGKFSFVCLENGYFVPTRELDLVRRVQEGKMSVNLQMKMWSESMWDINLGCPLLMPPELREYCEGMPPWVYDGTMQQAQKRILIHCGYLPTWFRNGLTGV
jgi:hypothetical protein